MARRWNLKELADFEECVAQPPVGSVDPARLRSVFSSLTGRSEQARRQQGLFAWFDQVKERSQPQSGAKIQFALKAIGTALCLLSFLAGAALMGGLIERIGLEGKAYNIWKVLAFTLALPWFLTLLGLIGLLIVRRQERSLTFVEEILSFGVKRLAGPKGVETWNTLYRAGKAYRAVLGWRLTRMIQGGAIFFNLGLIISLASSLWFLEISFFWASTLEEFSRPQLYRVTELLSWPWAAWFPVGVPTLEALELTQLQIGELNPAGRPVYWYPFLFCTLLGWGLLPRLLFWGGSVALERRAIRALPFMEKRHRDLWRALTSVSGSIAAQHPTDQVVVIDVGGVSTATEEIRPFLLQTQRVHPVARFTASTLEGNKEVLDHLHKAPQGALFLVESWALSPKQMETLHYQVRALIADKPILYLVLGLCIKGVTNAPPSHEFDLWKHFIVELNDPQAEVLAYQPAPSSPL